MFITFLWICIFWSAKSASKPIWVCELSIYLTSIMDNKGISTKSCPRRFGRWKALPQGDMIVILAYRRGSSLRSERQRTGLSQSTETINANFTNVRIQGISKAWFEPFANSLNISDTVQGSPGIILCSNSRQHYKQRPDPDPEKRERIPKALRAEKGVPSAPTNMRSQASPHLTWAG